MATFSKTAFCSFGILGIQPEPLSLTYCWDWMESTWRPPKLELLSPTSLTSDVKHIIKKQEKKKEKAELGPLHYSMNIHLLNLGEIQ